MQCGQCLIEKFNFLKKNIKRAMPNDEFFKFDGTALKIFHNNFEWEN